MNKVNTVCKIISDFEYSHSVCNTDFYMAYAETERQSGTKDKIRILVSSNLINIYDMTGMCVYISGQFRSHNTNGKLILFLFAQELYVIDDEETGNEIFLDGFVCKEPIYRTTPLGREIKDVMLAVNRAYGKSDYIPLVLWGKNARLDLKVGDALSIKGRVQSREYQKNGTQTAYEVSVCEVA